MTAWRVVEEPHLPQRGEEWTDMTIFEATLS